MILRLILHVCNIVDVKVLWYRFMERTLPS